MKMGKMLQRLKIGSGRSTQSENTRRVDRFEERVDSGAFSASNNGTASVDLNKLIDEPGGAQRLLDIARGNSVGRQ